MRVWLICLKMAATKVKLVWFTLLKQNTLQLIVKKINMPLS